MSPGSSDQRISASRLHTFTRTTSGSVVIVAESARPQRSCEARSAEALKMRCSPSRWTSRRTSAAVFCHSHSETVRVSSAEMA